MRHYLCVSGCNRDCVKVTNTWWGDVRKYGMVETNANGEERRARRGDTKHAGAIKSRTRETIPNYIAQEGREDHLHVL